MRVIEFPEDVEHLKAVIYAGTQSTYSDAEIEAFWLWRSEDWSAAWMEVPRCKDGPRDILQWWSQWQGMQTTFDNQDERQMKILIDMVERHIGPRYGVMINVGQMAPPNAAAHITNVDPEAAVQWCRDWLAQVEGSGFCSQRRADSCWCCGSSSIAFRYRGGMGTVSLCFDCENGRERHDPGPELGAL